ncbi:formylglycine-generating enzyme family protein [Leptospira brenneri]|uniref:Formylglycine-generating enzyme family protein n=2 Tax=Leptospira brenneri TaxID=2023182 RepID=A0A2M9Y0W2_9LEPT|nr:cysteine-type sulfatase aerobic maturase [Leptospira brenneri]TGK94053.1 formylglycine-generating enzyme family protein [Leptospira brenneri]
MVFIPSGKFRKGDSVYPEESPVYETSVSSFWMDETEVTNDQFSEFVSKTGYITEAETKLSTKGKGETTLDSDLFTPGAVVFHQPTNQREKSSPLEWWNYIPGANWRHPEGPGSSIEGKGSYPVVAITYRDAGLYAEWKGHSLPTEVEWEWAARGGGFEKSSNENISIKEANTWQGEFPFLDEGKDGFIGISPVGCYAKNGFGLYDMIGNVWEFTSDSWIPNQKLDKTKYHTIKGGSFLCAPNYCKRYRAAAKQPQEDQLASSHIGFRTILRMNSYKMKIKENL